MFNDPNRRKYLTKPDETYKESNKLIYSDMRFINILWQELSDFKEHIANSESYLQQITASNDLMSRLKSPPVILKPMDEGAVTDNVNLFNSNLEIQTKTLEISEEISVADEKVTDLETLYMHNMINVAVVEGGIKHYSFYKLRNSINTISDEDLHKLKQLRDKYDTPEHQYFSKLFVDIDIVLAELKTAYERVIDVYNQTCKQHKLPQLQVVSTVTDASIREIRHIMKRQLSLTSTKQPRDEKTTGSIEQAVYYAFYSDLLKWTKPVLSNLRENTNFSFTACQPFIISEIGVIKKQPKYYDQIIYTDLLEAKIALYTHETTYGEKSIFKSVKVGVVTNNGKLAIQADLEFQEHIPPNSYQAIISNLSLNLRKNSHYAYYPSAFLVNGKNKYYARAVMQLSLDGHSTEIKSIENKLIAIWKEILPLDKDFKPSCDDDFYALGGNSILISQLLTAIKKEYPDYQKDFTQFNTSPTIRSLVSTLASRSSDYASSISTYPSNPLPKKAKEEVQPLIFLRSVTGKDDDEASYIKKYQSFSTVNTSKNIVSITEIKFLSLENPGYIAKSLYNLARDYIQCFRNEHKRPLKAVFITGFYECGALAYEMARQLEKFNISVITYCINSINPTYYQRLSSQQYANHLVELVSNAYNNKINNDVISKALSFDPNHFAQYSKSKQLEAIWNSLQERLTHVQLNKGVKEQCFALYVSLCNIFNTQLDYQPTPINNVTAVYSDDFTKRYGAQLTTSKTSTELVHVDKTNERPNYSWNSNLGIKIIEFSQTKALGDIPSFIHESKHELNSAILQHRFSFVIDRIKQNALSTTQISYDKLSALTITGDYIKLKKHVLKTPYHKRYENKILLRECIIGDVGAGKTSYCQNIINQWLHRENYQEYKLIYMLDFDKKISKSELTVFEQLLLIIDKTPELVLFILDNYDTELLNNDENKTLSGLINKITSSENRYHSILTTHMSFAANDLDDYTIYRLAEFTPEQKTQYIENYFHSVKRNDLSYYKIKAFSETELAKDLMTLIKHDRDLDSFSNTPWFLSLFSNYGLQHLSSTRNNRVTEIDKQGFNTFIMTQLWSNYHDEAYNVNKRNKPFDSFLKLQNLLGQIAKPIYLSFNKKIDHSTLNTIIENWKNTQAVDSAVQTQFILSELLLTGFIRHVDYAVEKSVMQNRFKFTQQYFLEYFLLNQLKQELTWNQNDVNSYQRRQNLPKQVRIIQQFHNFINKHSDLTEISKNILGLQQTQPLKPDTIEQAIDKIDGNTKKVNKSSFFSSHMLHMKDYSDIETETVISDNTSFYK